MEVFKHRLDVHISGQNGGEGITAQEKLVLDNLLDSFQPGGSAVLSTPSISFFQFSIQFPEFSRILTSFFSHCFCVVVVFSSPKETSMLIIFNRSISLW